MLSKPHVYTEAQLEKLRMIMTDDDIAEYALLEGLTRLSNQQMNRLLDLTDKIKDIKDFPPNDGTCECEMCVRIRGEQKAAADKKINDRAGIQTGGYPLVMLDSDGEEFARINYDGIFSVDWEKTAKLADEPFTYKNGVVMHFANILLAIKDDLETRDWEQSTADFEKWIHRQRSFGIRDDDLVNGDSCLFLLANDGIRVAGLLCDQTWFVKWNALSEMVTEKPVWRMLAVSSFARMLLLAKDRFPFPIKTILEDQQGLPVVVGRILNDTHQVLSIDTERRLVWASIEADAPNDVPVGFHSWFKSEEIGCTWSD